MSDQPQVFGVPADGAPQAAVPSPAETDAERTERDKKKKAKVRSAWISFIGRIVAQFIGAAATIGLGLIVLQKYHAASAIPFDGPSAGPVGSEPQIVRAHERVPGHPLLAVLPLDDFSREPQQEHLANGMTEALITALSELEGLRVISRTSSMHYKSVSKRLPEIGRELGVDLIAEGSASRVGERVRVVVQIVDAETDEHLWSATYDRQVDDVLSLQAEVAAVLARDVDLELRSGRLQRFSGPQSTDRVRQERPLRDARRPGSSPSAAWKSPPQL